MIKPHKCSSISKDQEKNRERTVIQKPKKEKEVIQKMILMKLKDEMWYDQDERITKNFQNQLNQFSKLLLSIPNKLYSSFLNY